MTGKRTGAVVFGGTDGLVLILGLVLGLAVSRQPGTAVWHAGLAGGIAELGGMSLGQYWSDPDRDKLTAACNGLAGAGAVIGAAAPFAVMSGIPAVGTSLVIVTLLGLVITLLREETGMLAIVHTFGLLLPAAMLSAASGFL